jgi:hypothetical protein
MEGPITAEREDPDVLGLDLIPDATVHHEADRQTRRDPQLLVHLTPGPFLIALAERQVAADRGIPAPRLDILAVRPLLQKHAPLTIMDHHVGRTVDQ